MKNAKLKKSRMRNSLVVQWLGLHVLTAKGQGSIPGRETKIPQAARHGPQKKKKQDENYLLGHLRNMYKRGKAWQGKYIK